MLLVKEKRACLLRWYGASEDIYGRLVIARVDFRADFNREFCKDSYEFNIFSKFQQLISFFYKRVKNGPIFRVVPMLQILRLFYASFFGVCGECVGEPQLWFLTLTFLLALTTYIDLQKSNLYWHHQHSQAYLLIKKTLLKCQK